MTNLYVSLVVPPCVCLSPQSLHTVILPIHLEGSILCTVPCVPVCSVQTCPTTLCYHAIVCNVSTYSSHFSHSWCGLFLFVSGEPHVCSLLVAVLAECLLDPACL